MYFDRDYECTLERNDLKPLTKLSMYEFSSGCFDIIANVLYLILRSKSSMKKGMKATLMERAISYGKGRVLSNRGFDERILRRIQEEYHTVLQKIDHFNNNELFWYIKYTFRV